MLIIILKIVGAVMIMAALILFYGICIERYLVRFNRYTIAVPKLPVKNKTYSFGLKRSPKNQLVFISKGIGWGIFPGRLNCLPEIPILTLVPESQEN